MSNVSELVARARHCRDHGSFDALHGELLDMVEFLEQVFEAERDRANEHFEARQAAEADANEFRADLKAIADWMCDEANAGDLPGINSDVYWAHVENRETGKSIRTAVIELLARRVELEKTIEDMRELIART